MAKSNRPSSGAKAGQTARPKAQSAARTPAANGANGPSTRAATNAGSPRAAATGTHTAPAAGTSTRLQDIRSRAGQQPAARRPQQRRKVQEPWYKGAGAIWSSVVAIALIIAFIILLANRQSSDLTAISPTVASQVTGVSPQTLDKVGAGGLQQPLQGAPANTPLWKDSSGKPIVFYAGAEYCPFCAAERWSMIVALSRFGTFSNLKAMTSSDTDTPASVPTFSFRGATYTSQYITFIPRELQDRTGQPLYTLSGAEQASFQTYDSPPYVNSQSAGGIPFISFGNQYFAHSAGFGVEILNAQTRDSIAAKLNNPDDGIAQVIDGNANYLTSAICQITGNKPANVCTAAPIPNLQKQLPARS